MPLIPGRGKSGKSAKSITVSGQAQAVDKPKETVVVYGSYHLVFNTELLMAMLA